MNLLDLPIEIQEYILKLLDTSDLTRCSRVCTLWQSLSQNCWQNCCLREISEDILVEIIGGGCQATAVSLWENVFLKWTHYENIIKSPHQTFTLPFPNISSTNRCVIRLSGDFLIVAPTVENVRVYKVHLYENGKCIGVIAKHAKAIQDIAMIDVQRKGPYRLKGSRKKLCEHDATISVSEDNSVQLNEISCHGRRALTFWEKKLPADCTEATIKTFGNTFAVATEQRAIFVFAVAVDPMQVVAVQELAVIQAPIAISQFNIWKDEITCLSLDLRGIRIATWDMRTCKWNNVYIENLLCGPNLNAHRELIFGVGSALTIIKNCKLLAKFDAWETLAQRIPVEKVTALCLKRNLLIVGTQQCELYVFIINRDAQLRNLKITSAVNVIKVAPSMFPYGPHEVRYLDVSFDGCGIQIAAQTCLEVHVIRWFPANDKTLYQTPRIELPIITNQNGGQDDGDASDADYWFYDSD